MKFAEILIFVNMVEYHVNERALIQINTSVKGQTRYLLFVRIDLNLKTAERLEYRRRFSPPILESLCELN